MDSIGRNMCAGAILGLLTAGIKDVAAVCCSFSCGGCCDFTNAAVIDPVGLVCVAAGRMHGNVTVWRELCC